MKRWKEFRFEYLRTAAVFLLLCAMACTLIWALPAQVHADYTEPYMKKMEELGLLPFSFSFTQIPVVPLSCRLNTASRIIFSSSWTSSSNAAANSGIGSPEGRCRSTFMFSSRG